MLLRTKKEGVGGHGRDPLIITEPTPVTSYSLVSHNLPRLASLSVGQWLALQAGSGGGGDKT